MAFEYGGYHKSYCFSLFDLSEAKRVSQFVLLAFVCDTGVYACQQDRPVSHEL